METLHHNTPDILNLPKQWVLEPPDGMSDEAIEINRRIAIRPADAIHTMTLPATTPLLSRTWEHLTAAPDVRQLIYSDTPDGPLIVQFVFDSGVGNAYARWEYCTEPDVCGALCDTDLEETLSTKLATMRECDGEEHYVMMAERAMAVITNATKRDKFMTRREFQQTAYTSFHMTVAMMSAEHSQEYLRRMGNAALDLDLTKLNFAHEFMD